MMPSSGWINDPNGPLLFRGTYHMFYQHVPGSSTWEWGLCWGHAVSKDLVHWRHLPVAFKPTPGSLDQDGCFSGSATLDENGAPVILYTGVVRKPPGSFGPDVSPQYEFQLLARPADPDDLDLTHWVTEPYQPFLPSPFGFTAANCGSTREAVSPSKIEAREPSALDLSKGLTGWRDPFVISRPTAKDPSFYVMVGAGEKGRAGTALLYKSRSIYSGWTFVSELCRDPGCRMLECPLMVPLPSLSQRISVPPAAPAPASDTSSYLFCYSADYCANVSEYHIGPFQPSSGAFDLAAAGPPAKIDLGDIFYAPNVLVDKQGRTILWAWMQERERPQGTYDHACCLSAPRCLWLGPAGAASAGNVGALGPAAASTRLWQEPLPELSALRRGAGAKCAVPADNGARIAGNSTHTAAEPVRLAPVLDTVHFDLEVEVERGGASSGGFAVVLHPTSSAGEGAAVVFSWETGVLQVVHTLDTAAIEAAVHAPLPQSHRLCGFPAAEGVAAPAAATTDGEAAAEAAGRDVDVAAELEYGSDDGAVKLDPAAPAQASFEAHRATAPEERPRSPRRCGGRLQWLAPAARSLRLRLLLDHSMLEVFTSTGEALSTRVYRVGGAAAPDSAGTAPACHGAIELVTLGAGCGAVRAEAWEMDSMWGPPPHVSNEAAPVAAAPRLMPLEDSPGSLLVGKAASNCKEGAWSGSGDALREVLERCMQEQEQRHQQHQRAAAEGREGREGMELEAGARTYERAGRLPAHGSLHLHLGHASARLPPTVPSALSPRLPHNTGPSAPRLQRGATVGPLHLPLLSPSPSPRARGWPAGGLRLCANDSCSSEACCCEEAPWAAGMDSPQLLSPRGRAETAF